MGRAPLLAGAFHQKSHKTHRVPPTVADEPAEKKRFSRPLAVFDEPAERSFTLGWSTAMFGISWLKHRHDGFGMARWETAEGRGNQN
jgi:hypothetical protein